MIREASTVPAGTSIERDVCVVGAGAAGIALALDLARRGRSVCLLESGGDALQSPVQALYRGAAGAEGFLDREDYVWSSRLRFLGGATNHWRGDCERLDAADFAARPWVPNSGWPFDAATLAPWYDRAAGWLELSDPTPARAAAELPGFVTPARRWSPPTRFGRRYRDELAAAEGLLLLLRANAVALRANAAGARIEAVEVAVQPGATRFEVRAAQIVVAAGALENARLLLASPSQPGNAHDQVGRYFMDGLEGRVAELLELDAPAPAQGAGERDYRAVVPDAEMQREFALLNTRFVFEPVPAAPTGFTRDVGSLIRSVAAAERSGARPPGGAAIRRAIIATEMAPQPENRVTLSDERDPLGMPRLALAARPGELERASVLAATQRLAAALGASLSGRLQLELDPAEPLAKLSASQHPSGTTRMHADPRQGVVDADARVHGVANLFVAGSSVFPSGGHARPTWTLLALALRLADHVAGLPAETA